MQTAMIFLRLFAAVVLEYAALRIVRSPLYVGDLQMALAICAGFLGVLLIFDAVFGTRRS